MSGDALGHPADLLAAAAARYGDAPAFTVALPDGGGETLSFAEADRRADAVGAFLADGLGLAPGDVVALQLGNGLPFPLAVYGAWRAGLVVTPINPFYTAAETRRQLADSGPRALVADAAALDRLGDVPGELPVVAASGPTLARGADAPGRRSFADALAWAGRPDRPRHPVALYQYTGGTTGRSKGAVLTAANLLAAAGMVRDFFAANGSPIAGGAALTALPLYHIFSFLFGILVYPEAGVHDVIAPSASPLDNLRPAFERHPIGWMAGVDTLYAGLLAADWFRAAPPRLRFAIAGGAAVRPGVLAEWERVVSPLLEGYGLTETTGIVSCNPPTPARRAGSVGVPVPGVSVRLVDAAGAEVATGTPGELLVRGPQVTAGYLGDAVGAFGDGWFATGDVATLGPDGALTIVDRAKDMILVSGFNVYPTEVEAVLSGHPGVAEVAVVGVASERTGEAVRAFVVPRGPAPSAAELDRHCRASLAAYKVPREFVVRDVLPKSAVGKVLRAELRGDGSRPRDR